MSHPDLSATQSRTGIPNGVGLLLGTAAGTAGVRAIPGLAGVRPWHVLVLSALFVALWTLPPGSVTRLRLTMIDMLSLAFIGSSVFASYLNAGELQYYPDWVSVASPIFYLGVFAAARLVVAGKRDAELLLRGFSWPAVPVAVLAVLQVVSPQVARVSLVLAPSDALEARLNDARISRATGLIGHWTGSGFYFCAALAAVTIAALLSNKSTLGAMVSTDRVVVVAAVLGAMTSVTFSVILTAAAVGVAYWYRAGGRLSGLAGMGAGALGCYFLFRDLLDSRLAQQASVDNPGIPSWVPSTLAFRWRIWSEETMPAIMDRASTGWGSGVYSPDSLGRIRPTMLEWGSAESQWLSVAISYGVLTSVTFALLFTLLVWNLVRATTSGRGGSALLPAVALLGVAVLASFTAPVFVNRGLPGALWALLGASLALGLPRTYGVIGLSGEMFERGISDNPEARTTRDPSEVSVNHGQL